ncbi:hypothetical protein BJY04DRAFT_211276 [Aspergillus karnatakaensis]|uniref:uncharacterized protein n=1 Tax=Aspergillus karnatakaensis TaxID=1810916 RepID=UPI003CCCFCF9
MATKHHQSPGRLVKRSRATDAALDGSLQTKTERTKRRRTFTGDEETGSDQAMRSSLAVSTSTEVTPINIDNTMKTAPPDSWSLSRGVAGQFTNINPCLTLDEQYIFLSLESAIHIYSVTTSRLFRVIEISNSDTIIGYRLSPTNQERLYIFTLSGSVSVWDWPSNKQLSHWNTAHKTIWAELVYDTPGSGSADVHDMFFSLRERKDGKRELAITRLHKEKPQSTVILETSVLVEGFRVVGSGHAIVAYAGARLFLGSSCPAEDSEGAKYAWREVKLATAITCVDIHEDESLNQTLRQTPKFKKLPEVDLALGGMDGSILVYHDALSYLGINSGLEDTRKSAPRRLHWHREPVKAVRWSKDGNYVLSGGHESVMVLWQLDTGRKQFLPHLSSPICNIVISETGNSYAVKLADNRVVVLSARELQPLITITAVPAALHPQHPEQLLITVPASHQPTREGITSATAPVLQTYDIRTNTHISRQALARTNATTLNIGPDGTQVLTPDIKHLGVSEDGLWMATVDSWRPYFKDAEALHLDVNAHSELEEIHLKFWRWNESSSLWELVTRIDGPHLSHNGSASVLNIAPRPSSHEFATIGSDAQLRFWRPIIRQRHGLKRDGEQAPETWKCRNTLDFRGYLEPWAPNTCLRAASVCFSEDGSVLAICLQSTSTIPGLTVLVDVRSCSVKYSKIGAFSGEISAAAFLGCHLLIATNISIFIWDTVNDIVRMTDSSEARALGDSSSRLLAVNSRTQTFATATRRLHKKANSKKTHKSGFTVQLAKEPVALLSNLNSAEYTVVDAGANVQQLRCVSKDSQVSHTNNLIEYSDSGLEGLFKPHTASKTNEPSTLAFGTGADAEPLLGRSGLAGVFGDTPPFVLPPSHIVFCDLVDCSRSVEQRLPVSGTSGFLDNPHPSFVISSANGISYEPNDSDDESEAHYNSTSEAEATSSTHDPPAQPTIQTTNLGPNHSRTKSDDDEPPRDSPTTREETRPTSGSPMNIKIIPEKEEGRVAKIFSNSPISPPPLTTSIEPAADWSERATPRAQTRQDFDDIDKKSHSTHLEDIPEGIDHPKVTGTDQLDDQLGLPNDYTLGACAEIKALQAALVECWSLCNTLATLSSIHRERASFAVDIQDDAWKSCWRLCQQLYAGQVDDHASQVNPTLDLCRDFCQTLFETRARDNEISDSVLRVSFELNNHLYNTHDRNLPDAFRERTLDFYITLCHRLMKQRTRVPETDPLLSACWSLAEMLFSIRQSKKEGRPLDEELLGSAVQACWELCDIFREGWTQRSLRNSDRGTPRPSQATFALAEKQNKSELTRAEEVLFRQRNPETPTTIFEDIGTISPDEGPVQNIFVLGQRRNAGAHANWSSNSSSISARTQSSEKTSSTSTVVTLSNELSIAGLRVLVTKAAIDSGFQRNGPQGLSSFVKSLSSDAFGSAPWQVALLKHYKGLVAFEPTFHSAGPPTRASAMDIARAIKLTAQGGQYLWLYDLYRLVFGFHVEEVVNRDAIILQT